MRARRIAAGLLLAASALVTGVVAAPAASAHAESQPITAAIFGAIFGAEHQCSFWNAG